ncbi:MAG: Fur family transcriptional regulator [Candidatus Paceibacteria bacterium]
MQKRFSQKREDIRQYLNDTPGAVSAAAIHHALPHINLTTIYRNLDLFVAEGDVKKITLGGEALYEYQPHPHHHAVCDECHSVIHFTAPDEKIKQLLGLQDFTISNLELTVHGICNHKLAKK